MDENDNTISKANSNVKKLANNNLSKKDLNPKAVFSSLQDSDTFAFVLLTICLICYGEETFKVDPLVLFQFLKEDFGTELTNDNENKLSAILAALTTNFFFKDLSIFKSICETLTEGDPGLFDPGFEDPTVAEIIWGMYEVNLVYDEKNRDEYAPEIEQFVDKKLETDPEDTEESGLTNEETYQEFIYNNVALLKQQLKYIGIKDIPQFPMLKF